MYTKVLLSIVSVLAVTSMGGVASAIQPVDVPKDIVIDQPVDLHCPDHNTGAYPKVSGANADEVVVVGGVDVQVVTDGETVKFYDSEGEPLVVVFCVKGGNELTNTGKLTGSTYTHPQDISYVVVYEVPVDEPEEPEEPTTPVTPQETPTDEPQVDAPARAVNAGGGAVIGSAFALLASLGALGFGLIRSRN